jgi:hypothetical protein
MPGLPWGLARYYPLKGPKASWSSRGLVLHHSMNRPSKAFSIKPSTRLALLFRRHELLQLLKPVLHDGELPQGRVLVTLDHDELPAVWRHVECQLV